MTARWICAARLVKMPAFHDPDAAVEVVGEDAGDAGDHGDADEEAGDEAEERQGHQVEADVEAELRIVLAERLLVQEQQDFLPLAGRGAAGEQAEEDGKPDHDDAADRFELGLVAVQVVPDFRIGGIHRPRMVGNPDGEEDGEEHDGETCQEDDDPGQVLGQEHFEEAQLLVPEDIRPDIGEEDEADHDQGHNDQRRRQGASSCLGSSGRDSAGGTGQTRYLIAGRLLLVFSYQSLLWLSLATKCRCCRLMHSNDRRRRSVRARSRVPTGRRGRHKCHEWRRSLVPRPV